MTRRIQGLAAALLGAALLPAVAQDIPPNVPEREDARCAGAACDDGKVCEPMTLSDVDDTGAITSLTAVKQGEAWRVELFRQQPARDGNASEQRSVLVFEASAEADAAMKKLFEERPADPAEWETRIEDAANVELDIDYDGPTWRDHSTMREQLRQAFEEARAGWREASRRHRDRAEWRGWVRRQRGDGCCGGERRGRDMTARRTDRVFLENGDVVSGKILGVDEESVRIEAATGEVTLERDEVRRIALARPARARLGITLGADGAARVEEVKPGSAAARCGLRPGDVIATFGGEAVRDGKHLRELIREQRPGESIQIGVHRGEQTIDCSATLGDEDAPPMNAPIAPPALPEPGASGGARPF